MLLLQIESNAGNRVDNHGRVHTSELSDLLLNTVYKSSSQIAILQRRFQLELVVHELVIDGHIYERVCDTQLKAYVGLQLIFLVNERRAHRRVDTKARFVLQLTDQIRAELIV